jgi:hypothetical protein
MRVVELGCAAAVVAMVLSACGGEERRADNPRGSTSMQAASPTAQDQAWAALVEADREMKALTDVRDRTPDMGARNDVELQILELRARSDRLLDDMSIGDARSHDAAIRADIANLQRAIHAEAATEMQGEPPRH